MRHVTPIHCRVRVRLRYLPVVSESAMAPNLLQKMSLVFRRDPFRDFFPDPLGPFPEDRHCRARCRSSRWLCYSPTLFAESFGAAHTKRSGT